ncbi:hypothetical protein V3C99_017149 [Haemonchus contortus]
MPNVFKVNTSQRRFFTCCGKLHVKLAFLLIIAITIVAEVLETLSYVMNGWSEGMNLLAYALEVWEYIVTLTMILALVHESTFFLLPYIGEMFIVVTMMLILVFQLLFCVVAPYSSTAEQLFVDGRYTLWQREKKIFAILVFVTFFTGVAMWFLNVGLSTYTYFDYIAHKKNRRPTRLGDEPAPALVQSDALSRSSAAVTISFPNPNFSNNSDEDDEVFDRGVHPPVATV